MVGKCNPRCAPLVAILDIGAVRVVVPPEGAGPATGTGGREGANSSMGQIPSIRVKGANIPPRVSCVPR